MTTANSNGGQLVLFTPSADIADYFAPKELKDKDGNLVGHSFGLIKRKDIAAALEIDARKQPALLDRELLKISDAAKRQMVQVAVGLGQDNGWTGGRLTIRKSMNTNLRSATMRFVEVKREVAEPLTAEQIVEATGMPIEQVKAQMAAKAKKDAGTVDITITQTPALPNAAAPVTQAAKATK